jgi:hypothetical protein
MYSLVLQVEGWGGANNPIPEVSTLPKSPELMEEAKTHTGL